MEIFPPVKISVQRSGFKACSERSEESFLDIDLARSFEAQDARDARTLNFEH
jgi:hypothetical protein